MWDEIIYPFSKIWWLLGQRPLKSQCKTTWFSWQLSRKPLNYCSFAVLARLTIHLNIRMLSHWYRNSHSKGKTVSWLSYLYKGNPFTRKDVFYIETGTCSMPWWCHQMETFSTLLALCAGNSPVTGECPSQRPVTWSFYVFFEMRLKERLRKQSLGWWIETPLLPLWRHCNADSMFVPNGHIQQCTVWVLSKDLAE